MGISVNEPIKENAFFLEMMRVGQKWEDEKRERKSRKEKIIETLGWDSEELKVLSAEDEAITFPYSGGEMKAYWAWRNSVERKEDEIEMDDFVWAENAVDFVKTLRLAGIQSFVYTNRSSAVMDNILDFIAAGCSLLGPAEVFRKSRWHEEDESVKGIRFKLN